MQHQILVQAVRRRKRLRSYQKSLLLMLIPGLIFFAVYKYYPMYGVLIAFKKA